MKSIPIILVLFGFTALARADVATAPHAKVVYNGIDAQQAEALAKTISAARKIYALDFGFDMPNTAVLTVTCGKDEPVRLYNDGQDRMFLSIPSKKKLAKPSRSGVYHLYGICHELGHIAMYRTLKDRDWMSNAAAEGWAHYAGSVVVDRVYKAEGDGLWPDKYDYRQDGVARLEKESDAKSPSSVSQAAARWRDLEKLIERRGFARLFTAWQSAGIDPAKPAKPLQSELLRLRSDKEKELTKWWKEASDLFVEQREASKVEAEEISAKRLSGHPVELAFDDNGSDGKKSIAGGGHARKFAAPGPGAWYLCAVSVHGARYGPAKAPDTKFEIALCDEEMKPIATWSQPYEAVERGEPEWVRLEIPPTRVPAKFYICLNFRPTATDGVYVGYDDSTKGSSVVGTPGKKGMPLREGDWMIRVELDQPKEADPLQSGGGNSEKR